MLLLLRYALSVVRDLGGGGINFHDAGYHITGIDIPICLREDSPSTTQTTASRHFSVTADAAEAIINNITARIHEEDDEVQHTTLFENEDGSQMIRMVHCMLSSEEGWTKDTGSKHACDVDEGQRTIRPVKIAIRHDNNIP